MGLVLQRDWVAANRPTSVATAFQVCARAVAVRSQALAARAGLLRLDLERDRARLGSGRAPGVGAHRAKLDAYETARCEYKILSPLD